MVEISVNELHEQLNDILKLASVEQEPVVVIDADKKPIAAIIPMQAYNYLRVQEDRYTLQEIESARSASDAARSR
jgi:PHD/YefM family antitoxin component YafN of YafNO toxin-antitoxin module